MGSIVRWIFGIPKVGQALHGLTLEERSLLYEMRNEFGDIDATLDQIANDIAEMETKIRLDDAEKSLVALSDEISRYAELSSEGGRLI